MVCFVSPSTNIAVSVPKLFSFLFFFFGWLVLFGFVLGDVQHFVS